MAETPLGLFGFAAASALPSTDPLIDQHWDPEPGIPWFLRSRNDTGPSINSHRPSFPPPAERHSDYRQVTAANFSFMLKLATWTADEFVMLLLGRDFRRFNWQDAPASLKHSMFAERFLDTQEIVVRAVQAGQLPERGPPAVFVVWAREHEIAMPEELKRYAAQLFAIDAGRRKEQRAKAAQAEYTARLEEILTQLAVEVQRFATECESIRVSSDSQIEALKSSRAAEVEQLAAMIEELGSDFIDIGEDNRILRFENDWLWSLLSKAAPDALTQARETVTAAESELEPRREKSRNRIALGLAMSFCGFEPHSKPSGPCQRVVDALAQAGIQISDRTVATTLQAIHAELAAAGEFS